MFEPALGDIYTIQFKKGTPKNYQLIYVTMKNSSQEKQYCLLCLETLECSSFISANAFAVYSKLLADFKGSNIIKRTRLKMRWS